MTTTPPIASDPPRHFEALDGLRGVAALCVLAAHCELNNFHSRWFERGYLAVDLFFMLSAFVLAYSQGPSLKAGVGPFMKKRLIRLYPMILIGAVLGAIVALLTGMPASKTGLALVAQLLLIPFIAGGTEMFLLNGAQWSLVFELLGNLVHAVTFPAHTTRRLAVVVALGGLAVLVAAHRYQGLGVGWGRANWLGGVARLAFGYGAGLLLYRLHAAGRLPRWGLGAPLLLLALPVIVFLPTGHAAKAQQLRDALTVLVVFPALIITALHTRLVGIWRRIARLLGAASYPIYCLYGPLKQVLTRFVAPSMPSTEARLLLWSGFFIGMILIGTAAAYWIDLPSQAWLKRVFKARPAAAASPPQPAAT